MTQIWILVANASEARFYSSPKAKLLNGDAHLSEVTTCGHPESRMKGEELVSDRPGHNGHGTFVEPLEPKKIEADLFAKQLASTLETGRVANKFDEIILVAPGHFQNLLKQHSNQQLHNMINVAIDKDYTKVAAHELLPTLLTHL